MLVLLMVQNLEEEEERSADKPINEVINMSNIYFVVLRFILI